jgi:D-lyxose ketol-isomerase
MTTNHRDADRRSRVAAMIRLAGMELTDDEVARIEITDLGLGNLEAEGVQIATMVSTPRLAFKAIALFGGQTMPQHRHPVVGDDPGKEETIRVLSGECRLYVPGEDTLARGYVPGGKEDAYTVRNELVMRPGDQRTVEPGTWHWFQPGDDGMVVLSISTTARDTLDEFSDPAVVR